MSLLDKKYAIIEGAPKETEWELYAREKQLEYEKILEEFGDDEMFFQHFFERNPSFLPGAFEIFGHSGHYPFMDTIISQPQIGGAFKRFPDFLWLANDSLTFCPVFIEIEKPNKKMFNKNGTITADFNQAMGQINEWKYLLNNPVNTLLFYDYFNVPDYLRKREFKPQFVLIYGRRAEYQNEELLRGIRAEHRREQVDIFSYDRLVPSSDCKQFVSCKVRNKEYEVICIPPTFRYRADCADTLCEYKNFVDAIDKMEMTTEERKQFLKSRYEYWCEFGRIKGKGLIVGHEGE